MVSLEIQTLVSSLSLSLLASFIIYVCVLLLEFRYTEFGGPTPRRSAEDTAFAVARFIQNNGSFFNYYMVSHAVLFFSSNFFPKKVLFNCIRCLQYHGGTNFGRTAGRFIATSYDYDAPLDEYGMIHQIIKSIYRFLCSVTSFKHLYHICTYIMIKV